MKKRLTFGLIVDWISGWGEKDYYQKKIMSGVEDFVHEHDINLVTFVTGKMNSPYEWERSRNILFDFINKNHLDGLLVLPAALNTFNSEALISDLHSSLHGIPIVTVGDTFEGIHSVASDNYNGMKKIVGHLIETHGCSRIVFIRGRKQGTEAAVRLSSYLDQLEAHGIPIDEQLIIQGEYTTESGSKAVQSLIENNIQYDAIVASNDSMAIGAMLEFYSQDGRLPNNVPITGFDDLENSGYYGLTTIKQSFYEFARKASSTLLAIIQGQQQPLRQEISTELVLRTSCGCIPNPFRMSFVDDYQMPDKPFELMYRLNEDTLIHQLHAINASLCANMPDLMDEMMAFEQKTLSELMNVIDANNMQGFFAVWNEFLAWLTYKKLNLQGAQKVLTCMRNVVLKCISDPAQVIRAENMFQAAHMLIGDYLERNEITRNYLSMVEAGGLDRLAEGLLTTLDIQSQMDLVCSILPEFSIETCYLALYENPCEPLKKSRLILAFNERGRLNTGEEGVSFRTPDLLPERYMRDLQENRFSIIVQALYQGDNPIGFVIFGADEEVNNAYEIVRYRLSASLKASLLIENIQKQANELEKKVVERTKELSMTNEQLVEEISKREDVEERLRKVLQELEASNQELHSLATRDELTGLYNRRGFMTLAKQYYENAKRKKHAFLLLFLDLDELKQVNDRYGHAEGDEAIRNTAEIISRSFRKVDTFARLGGDEFTVLVVEAVSEDETYFRNRLIEEIHVFNKNSGKAYELSISMGAASYNPESNITFDDLLKKADHSLYLEKAKRKKEQSM